MERMTTRSGFTNEVYLTGKADVCWADRPIEERAFCAECHRHKGMDRTNCGALMLIDRLAAYEDTGLEPEEVRSQKELFDYLVFDSTPSEDIERFKRLRELAEADREGRCVVLPCKNGDPVWRLYDDCDFPGDCYTKQKCRGCEYRNLFIEEQAFCLSMLSQNGKLNPPYYTTRAEAEAALRREQE